MGMLVLLLIVGLGPILWLAKSAVTPTQDTLRMPMALWPHGIDLDNLATAWNRVHIDRYFGNTIVIAAGSWLVQIVVATTAAMPCPCSGRATRRSSPAWSWRPCSCPPWCCWCPCT